MVEFGQDHGLVEKFLDHLLIVQRLGVQQFQRNVVPSEDLAIQTLPKPPLPKALVIRSRLSFG
jgi:hypothetical protein